MGGQMNRSVAGKLAAIVLASGGAFSLVASPAQAQNFHYTYQKAAMPIMLDATRVAVFRDTDAAALANRGALPRPTILESMAELGLDAGEATPMVVKGWATVEAQPAAERAGPGGVADIVFRMANAAVGDFVSPVFADEYGPVIITRDILIGFEADITHAEADRMISDLALGVVLDRDFQGMPGLYRVRSHSRNGFDVLQQTNDISFRPEVRYAEPDMIRTTRYDIIPNDPSFGTQWALRNTGQSGGVANMDMDADLAWDITAGEPTIKVVVIDNGADLTHPDLNLAPGIDTTGGSWAGGHDPSNPCDGHGTQVAGCISAKINNAIGIAGVAPNTRVSPARFNIPNIPCDGSGSLQVSWVTGAINFAQTSGARVTNNSNGFGASASIDTAYNNTRAAGVVHFASAGNSGAGTIGYPSSIPSVNSVAAVTRTGAKASFSQFGPGLDFSAPGQSILTTFRGGGFGTVDGTSFSSPYAAGVAALLLSRNNLLTPTDVENTMAATAKDLGAAGFDTTFGWGFVNAKSGLDATSAPTLPGAFNLLTPANLATDQARKPTFTWSAAQFASSYNLVVDNDPSFASPEININTSFTSFTHTGTALAANTAFFWNVVAVNDLGTRDSTPATFSFTTLSNPPGAFTLTAPANGATGAALTPSFQWTAAPLAEEYRIRVDDNADFSSPIVDFTTALTNFSSGTAFAPSSTFFWTVTAINPIGSIVSTPSSASFTTVGAPPQPFNLLSPADGPNIATRTPTLMWSLSGGATSYTVLVDDDLGFGSPAVNETGVVSTSFMVPANTLMNQTRYFWRVFAVNASGSIISTPTTFSFGVVVPLCTGDANSDGVVNFSDITSVLSNWGANYGVGNTGPGDADKGGAVNFADVSSVLSNWNLVCP